MKKKIITAIIILSATCVSHVSAGAIIYALRCYENVAISTPGRPGEIWVHTQMAGKYAAMLAKELGYSEKISIDFDFFNPEYYGIDREFLTNYDKGEWRYKRNGKWKKNPQKTHFISIKYSSDKVDFVALLKLLEYAILNRDEVEKKQENVVFERKYHEALDLHSLPVSVIDSILRQPASAVVSKVLSNKIYLKDVQEKVTHISYYTQNGKFYVYYWSGLKMDEHIIIREFDHIWLFSSFNYGTAIVFDTPVTFRYLDGQHNKVSAQHSIGDRNVAEYPCNVTELGDTLVSIVMKDRLWGNPIDKTMLYIIPRDSVVFDLEEIFDAYPYYNYK